MTTMDTTTTTKKTTHYYLRAFAVLVGLVVAALVALATVGVDRAEAAFPGANGKIVFESDRTTGTGVDNSTGDEEIFTMNKDGTEQTQLTHNAYDDLHPSFSADGSVVAFISYRDINWEIYKMDSNGSNETRITTTNTATESSPTVSPDGSKIAYSSNRNGNYEIIVLEGGVETNLTNNAAYDSYPAFSPDGTKIAFVSTRNGDNEIYVMDTNPLTNDAKPLTNNTVLDDYPEWSPNGQMIAFRSLRNGNNDIFVMNALDGSSQKRLTKNAADDVSPAWSPDGRKIAFTSRRGGDDYEIYTMKARPEGSKNRPIKLTNNDFRDYGPDWQPLLP